MAIKTTFNRDMTQRWLELALLKGDWALEELLKQLTAWRPPVGTRQFYAAIWVRFVMDGGIVIHSHNDER